jgi:hypothetical protein
MGGIMQKIGILDGYVDRQTLAAELRCNERTIARYENIPNGLPSVLIAGRKLYPVDAIRSWVKTRERHPNQRRGA